MSRLLSQAFYDFQVTSDYTSFLNVTFCAIMQFNKNCAQKCVPHTIPFPETLCQIKNQIYKPFLEMHSENLLHQMTNTNDQM